MSSLRQLHVQPAGVSLADPASAKQGIVPACHRQALIRLAGVLALWALLGLVLALSWVVPA